MHCAIVEQFGARWPTMPRLPRTPSHTTSHGMPWRAYQVGSDIMAHGMPWRVQHAASLSMEWSAASSQWRADVADEHLVAKMHELERWGHMLLCRARSALSEAGP